MTNINDADNYFEIHQENEAWYKLDSEKKSTLLEKAETYINNTFDLREGTKETSSYAHAIYEQAIFLLTFDKERAKLQREGVKSYKVEDLSFQMESTIISPIAHTFLKKYIYKKMGKIV